VGSLPDLEILVERETNGLNRDVLVVLLLQEGSLLSICCSRFCRLVG
jgi:hypothetical protein